MATTVRILQNDIASGEFVEIDGLRLHYTRQGEGPPLVLLHGAGGNLRDWTFRAAPALARAHEVIAFDRPGLGLSQAPRIGATSPFVQADLLRRALIRLGVRRATLAGHSYGGVVALAWALDAPETLAGLLLIGAPSQVWRGRLRLITEFLARPLTGPLLARAAPLIASERFVRDAVARIFAPDPAPEGYIAHLRRELLIDPLILRRNARQLIVLKSTLRRMVARYPSVELPVEILHGTADPIVPLELHAAPLAAQLRRGRLTALVGRGHMPHHSALPEVMLALERLQNGGGA